MTNTGFADDALSLAIRTARRLAAALAVAAVLPLGLPGQAPAPAGPLEPDTEARIRALEEQVIAWRRDIHQHPELGNRETRTARLVADHLRGLGIAVTTGVAHTGVVGILRGGRPGPTVALRADMDALPVRERTGLPFASTETAVYAGQDVGVMHACGHDTHVAILMAVAEVLAGMRAELPGTVKFIFQPAEEGPPPGEEGGAELMVREGVLENPVVDAIFGLHISSEEEVGGVYWTPGGTMASADDFRILVKGKQTHGAAPWNGIDPVLAAAHIVTALQSVVSRTINLTQNPAVVTVGRISGGVRSNIVPEEVELIGTLRALNPEDRERIHSRVRAIAENTAEAMGATVEVAIPHTMGYPVTYNDSVLTRFAVPVLEAVVGPSGVVRVPPETGAEDFSFFAEQVPGFYFFLGGRPADVAKADATPHHTPEFYVDEAGLALGVRAMTALAVEYLRRHAAARAEP